VGAGCKKKKKNEQANETVPRPGGASTEVVDTGLGTGLALDAHLAPTSTQWSRVVVLGESHLVLVGHANDKAVVLRTRDGGRSWTSLQTPSLGWAECGAADDGSVVVATGKRTKGAASADRLAPIASAELWFGGPEADKLAGPAVLFPAEGPLEKATIPEGYAIPAVLSSELAAVLAKAGDPQVIYGAPAGKSQPEPVSLPAGEQYVPVPYGRPPSLLSIHRNALHVRPWPKPGEKIVAASRIPGLELRGNLARQLHRAPACETGPWTFQRLVLPGNRPYLLGVSESRSLAFALPPGESPRLGCHAEAVVVETLDPEKKVPMLIRCTLDGKCASPMSQPFRIWTQEHTREIVAVPTSQGVLAVMSARAGERRWGLYLAQSLDGGKTFELAQTIGEGTTDRGHFVLGALASLPKRTLLLISAEVTGTTRRGWYVLASDDGGENWGPP